MHKAAALIVDQFGRGNVVASPLYRTPPVGGPSGQSEFLNAVLAVDSPKSPFEMWNAGRSIEEALGRERFERWEARRIDVDILLSGQQKIWTPQFKVPHPRIGMRRFILEPANDVAADWIEPVSSTTIGELLENTRSRSSLIVVFSESLELFDRLLQHMPFTAKTIVADSIYGYQIDLTSERTVMLIRSSPDALPDLLTRMKTTASWLPSRFQRIETGTKNESDEGFLRYVGMMAVAVAAKDPESVAWEDASRRWAELLGMSPSRTTTSVDLAFPSTVRYLFDASDPRWAAHELFAAFDAMQCTISKDQEPFLD
jgi:2-amino-4-hydroxy-6-hydroxymethyldihydropteridine diphosphokinase